MNKLLLVTHYFGYFVLVFVFICKYWPTLGIFHEFNLVHCPIEIGEDVHNWNIKLRFSYLSIWKIQIILDAPNHLSSPFLLMHTLCTRIKWKLKSQKRITSRRIGILFLRLFRVDVFFHFLIGQSEPRHSLWICLNPILWLPIQSSFLMQPKPIQEPSCMTNEFKWLKVELELLTQLWFSIITYKFLIYSPYRW